jgi:UDP-N-acetylmuramate-alanine ligase
MFSSEIKSVHFVGIGGTAMASAADSLAPPERGEGWGDGI